MSELSVLSQQILTPFGSDHYSFTNVYYNASGDTVEMPAVPESAAVIPASGNTAPSIAVASGDNTVTLTGGTTGANITIVAKHAGSAAGVDAAGVGA